MAGTRTSGLITHVDSARLFGGRILAAHEEQPSASAITLPLGGDFLLLSIGDLIAIEDGAETHRGIVNAVSVSASLDPPKVRQTLTVGEDTPNLWAQWTRILPQSPLLLATVTAIHADATRTVELFGGGTQRVRGEGGVGDVVWVRAGRIEGRAPSLAHFEIEV